MMSRVLSPLVGVALLATSAVAQHKPALPPLTAQLQPVGKMLDDMKAVVRMALGADAKAAFKTIDQALEDKLGPEGFEGLDLTRPVAVAVYLPEKFDFASLLGGNEPDPSILEEFYGFVLVPITNEKDFLGLLSRLNVEHQPVQGVKGLHAIIPPDQAIDDDPTIRFRFHAGYAYIGVNVDDQDLDAEVLPAAADIIVPGESALFSERVYYQRLPKGIQKDIRALLDKLPQWLQDAPLPDSARDVLSPLVTMYRRYGQQIVTDGETGIVRLQLNLTTGELGYEFGFTAKSGSPLAQEIADRKPTTNSFAGLFGPETAAGFLLQLPLFAPEIREAIAIGLDFARQATADQIPDEVQDIVEELWKGVGRTVKTGKFDIAAAVAGPDKAGTFAAAVAISYVNAGDLEKVLRRKLEDAPEEIQNQIKLDAAQANGVNIHRMPVGLFLPPEAKKLFGDRPSVAMAFGPRGIYLTFGPDAVGTMKAALALTPGPAKALDVLVNPAKISQLAEAANPGAKDEVAKTLGTDDQLVSLYGLSVDTGPELTIRITMSLLPLVRGIEAGYRGEVDR